ncbi:MAG: response regulator [Xenococcus sp. (in: cyanobacteria)]
MRILLVDDDQTLVDLLTRNLGQQNYAVDVAIDGEQGWIYGSTYSYDLMILDWSLPKLDGISLCQRFRAHGYVNPIILLTSRDGSQNKIKGLDAGADDYICKPFDIEELSARIRTLLRRINCDFFPVLSWGKLQLNPCNCTVTYQGQSLSLGAKEYRLLELFLRHSQEVLSIEEIIDHLWSASEYPAEATVRSHLRRLRQKLKQAGLPEDLIITIRRQGYALKPFLEDDDTNKNLPIASNQQAISPAQIPDKRAEQIAALTAIWEKHQPKREQQLVSLEQAIVALQAGKLTTSDRISAIVIAHSLVGSLGQFGLERASQIAKAIEQILQDAPNQNSPQLGELSNKLQDLKAELRSNQNIKPKLFDKLTKDALFLLIVNDDASFTEQ